MAAGRGSPTAVGSRAEHIAEQWLQARGLRPLARNYRRRRGELDLVMLEEAGAPARGATLVVVEVRYRRNAAYGEPEVTVGAAKRRRIAAATRLFLAEHPELATYPVRFDVVALLGSLDAPCVRWIRGAFAVS